MGASSLLILQVAILLYPVLVTIIVALVLVTTMRVVMVTLIHENGFGDYNYQVGFIQYMFFSQIQWLFINTNKFVAYGAWSGYNTVLLIILVVFTNITN